MLKFLFKIEKAKKDINNINNTIDEIEIELNKIKQMINK
jgi:hypothetical protein